MMSTPSVTLQSKGGRRVSMGGIAMIEDEDFGKAMGKLLGTYAASNLSRSSQVDELGETEFGNSNSQKPVLPYWHTGPKVDTSVFTTERTVTKPRLRYGVDHAIVDPNPAPRPNSLAVPPPPEIMHPQGNSVANHRLEKCLLYNDVVVAQKVASNTDLLSRLIQEALFRRACVSCGYDPEGLLPQARTRFKTDPISGRLRTKDEQNAAAEQYEIARVKHIALVFTEYKDLCASEASKVREVRVQVRRASMSMQGAGVGGGSEVGTGRGDAEQIMRFVSLRELGVEGGETLEHPHGTEAVDGQHLALGPESSIASMPESLMSMDSDDDDDDGEAAVQVEGPEAGQGGGLPPLPPPLAPPIGGYSAEVMAEAASVGLDPGLVVAAREAKASARLRLSQVEQRSEAIIAAARASVTAVRPSAAGTSLYNLTA